MSAASAPPPPAAGGGGGIPPSGRVLELTPALLPKFGVARVFADNSKLINALDWSADGELCVTSADDESIHLYNAESGELKKTVNVKKFGANLVRMTHSKSCVLVASKNSWDDSIRYLSLYDNQYLRFFKGHRGRVVSLEMGVRDDTFLSGSLDLSVRVWDLRTHLCQGMIRVDRRPAVAVDRSSGLVFAVGQGRALALYDARKYGAGAFAEFPLPPASALSGEADPRHPPQPPAALELGSVQFSPDGNLLLVNVRGADLFALDAFSGQLKAWYRGRGGAEEDRRHPGPGPNPNHAPAAGPHRKSGNPGFSPDGRMVVCGSDDKTVAVWEAAGGRLLHRLRGPNEVAYHTSWNPRRMLLASAGVELAFWTPDL